MGAKGGNLFRLRGKHLSVTLTALVATTILLWAWENSPLVSLFLSTHDQFVVPSSEVLVDPLLPTNTKVDTEQDYSNSFKTTEARRDQTEETLNTKVNIEQDYSNSFKTKETRGDQTEESLNPKVNIEQDYSNSFETTDTRSDQTRTSLDSKVNAKQGYSNSFRTTETRRDQTEKRINLAPTNFSTTFSTERSEDVSEPSVETKDCNYAKGKWVADSRRPLYSGFGCKQWLSEMWACRLTQRPDFSYEAFRWQPKNCKMPEFTRSRFFKRMQHKTLAFVGDSLARQQFQSLMCMVSGGEEIPDVHNIGRNYGLVKPRGAVRPDGWAFRFPSTNTTMLYYWSATLCDLVPINITDPKTDVAMHLDRPPAFLRTYLPTFDVLVLNTGHHWNRGKLVGNRWVMHVDGKPLVDKKLAPIGNAKNFTVHSIVKWVDSQFPHHPRLKAFFRTISPRHFAHGDWNTGGTCDNTSPLAGGSEVSQDESSDPVIASAVKGSKVKLLDITAISQLRDEGHISRYTIRQVEGMQDCLHWCLPGIPDTWNELLCAQI